METLKKKKGMCPGFVAQEKKKKKKKKGGITNIQNKAA